MSVYVAHKAAVDNDIFSIDVSSWLSGASIDISASSVNVWDRSTPPINMNATMYTGGSLAVGNGIVTFFLKGGTAGQTYDVYIDLATSGSSPRKKRFRMSLTVVD